ncbi:unnamed protein product, partial [Ostreobium quekettii]
LAPCGNDEAGELRSAQNGERTLRTRTRKSKRTPWNTTLGTVLTVGVVLSVLLANGASAQQATSPNITEIFDELSFIRKEVSGGSEFTKAMRWSAIAIGAATNIVVAGFSSLVNILHLNGGWSLRTWMLLHEWWYWTLASVLVTIALIFDVLAFVGGEDVDATILILAAEMAVISTTFTTRAYQIHRRKVLIYKAWNGMSRSARSGEDAWVTHMTPQHWHRALKLCKVNDGNVTTIESKYNPGNWVAWYTGKTRLDPGVVMDQLRKSQKLPDDLRQTVGETEKRKAHAEGYVSYYPDIGDDRLSILWGGRNSKCFQVRTSRSVTSFDVDFVTDTYSYTKETYFVWVFIAGGVLGRNKGLLPHRLRFMSNEQYAGDLLDHVINDSTWYPRPAKTRRTKVHKQVKAHFHGLGDKFVNAGTELSLLMEDVDDYWLIQWLDKACEHQEYQTAWGQSGTGGEAWQAELYLSSYVSMMVSLNNGKRDGIPRRVDTLCAASVLIQEGSFRGIFEKLSDALKDRIRNAVEEDMDALADSDDAADKIVKTIVLYSGATDKINEIVSWRDVRIGVGLDTPPGDQHC